MLRHTFRRRLHSRVWTLQQFPVSSPTSNKPTGPHQPEPEVLLTRHEAQKRPLSGVYSSGRTFEVAVCASADRGRTSCWAKWRQIEWDTPSISGHLLHERTKKILRKTHFFSEKMGRLAVFGTNQASILSHFPCGVGEEVRVNTLFCGVYSLGMSRLSVFRQLVHKHFDESCEIRSYALAESQLPIYA